MKQLIFAAALILAATSQSIAANKFEGRIGAWEISSFTDDQSGQFTHCVTFAPFRSGINMVISIDNGFNWRMGFQNPRWHLSKGNTYPVTYWIDAGPQLPADAYVTSPDMVVVDLYNSTKLFNAFRRGRALTVLAAGDRFQFDLTNSSKALTAVLECTDRYVSRSATAENPFGPNSQPDSPDKSLMRAEATAYAANLLSAAGVTGFTMVDLSSDPSMTLDAVFVSDGLVGGVMVSPSQTVESASNGLMAAVVSRCSGKLATAKLPTDSAGTHIESICESSVGREESSYFVVPRPKGGVYGFMLTQAPLSDDTRLPGAEARPSPSPLSAKLLETSLTVAR